MALVFPTLYVQICVVTNCQEVNYSYSIEASLKNGFGFSIQLGADYSAVTSFKQETPAQ